MVCILMIYMGYVKQMQKVEVNNYIKQFSQKANRNIDKRGREVKSDHMKNMIYLKKYID